MHYLFCVKVEMRKLSLVRRPQPDVLRVVGGEQKGSGVHRLEILTSLNELYEIRESERFNTQIKLNENRYKSQNITKFNIQLKRCSARIALCV